MHVLRRTEPRFTGEIALLFPQDTPHWKRQKLLEPVCYQLIEEAGITRITATSTEQATILRTGQAAEDSIGYANMRLALLDKMMNTSGQKRAHAVAGMLMVLDSLYLQVRETMPQLVIRARKSISRGVYHEIREQLQKA